MGSLEVDFVITTDRTMMSNHHGKEFLGFIATGPPIGMPESLWLWLTAPKVKTDKYGRPVEAPYGLRKIEAALLDHGFKAAIIDPDYIDRYLYRAKALLIGHHDFFALCPPSSEWWFITGKEPVNARSFRRLMEKECIRAAKRRGLKIIVGGPAAWQWLWKIDEWIKWGVDTVVDGEAEKVIVDLAQKVIDGEELPRYIYISPRDAPSIEEIPVIKYASVNGLVEIMRGCPRGCRFCSVTLRPLRYIPLDMIESELKVNVRYGIREGVIHSEDVLLYGAKGVIPQPEPLIKLHMLVKRYYRVFAWSHASLSSIKYAQEKYKLITKLTEIVFDEHQDFWGVEVGIETGSPKLAEKVMPAKVAPYPARTWPNVVEDAFAIMHEHRIIPAATIILGLPGETVDDVIATLELLDRLKDYRSLIVPMFFVPMGLFKNKDWFKAIHLRREHLEVMRACLLHSLKWAEDILNKFYMRGPLYLPVKLLLKMFLTYVRIKSRKYITDEFLNKFSSKQCSNSH